jgi:hypothetical protein
MLMVRTKNHLVDKHARRKGGGAGRGPVLEQRPPGETGELLVLLPPVAARESLLPQRLAGGFHLRDQRQQHEGRGGRSQRSAGHSPLLWGAALQGRQQGCRFEGSGALACRAALSRTPEYCQQGLAR